MAPDTFLVERSTVTAADSHTVFEFIDDLHRWKEWSPWEELDPDMVRTYAGSDRGVGSSYAWAGNRRAGSGSLTIIESVPGRKVVLDLAFLKPFRAQNVATFLLEPSGEGTAVTWRMTGRKTWFFKVFGFVFTMDRIVGKDFEKGLAALKAVAETAS